VRIAAASVALIATAFVVSACGDETDVGTRSTDPATAEAADSRASSTPPPGAVSEHEAPPMTMSAEQICATLTPNDIAPLTDGEVTDKPQPTMNLGSPGCRWPVENGYGWLAIDVFKPVSVDAILATAVRQYKVGDGTGYQQFDADGSTLCQALVRTPQMPDGYLVRVKLDGGGDHSANLCEKSVPQTEKVLEALKW
jgi:hypothetical protein